MIVSLQVNGVHRDAVIRGHESLLEVLRDHLELTGSKGACEQGECGSCTVLLDGVPLCSCLVLAAAAEGVSVETIEGVGGAEGSLNPVQQALVAGGAVQCGFCTPGIVMAATALLRRGAALTQLDIREELGGNLCRCTGYGAVIRSLEPLLREEKP